MEDFSKKIFENSVVISSTLTRATLKEAKELKKIIDEEFIFRHYKLVVDLSDCEFIDSTFLGVIVYAHKKCLEMQGKLNVVMNFNVNKDLFYVTSTFKVLNVFEQLDEAISDFEKTENLPVRELFNNVN